MREELGIELGAEQVIFLCAHRAPWRRYIYYALWPRRAEDFVLGEGRGYAWFLLETALRLPDLVERTRADLRYFRDRIVSLGPGEG